MTMRKLGILTVALVAATGLALAERSVEETRPASPDGIVEIETISGTIVLIGWDRDEVRVTGTLGEGIDRVDISGDRDRISIEVEYLDHDHDRGHRRHYSYGGADLEIHVPRDNQVEVETVSADIRASDHSGELELESVSGRIRIQGSPREVEAATVSGEIEVATDKLRSGDFQTVSGSIDVNADLASGGDFDFEAVSGDIVLRVPAGVSASFDISSFSGSIQNDFGHKPEKTSQYLPSTELSFSVGGGGARVSIETLSGRVRVLHQ
jgi:DUF4097 and DUF4098 domain-containing protein YvlB